MAFIGFPCPINKMGIFSVAGRDFENENKSLKEIIDIDKEDRPTNLINEERFILSNLRKRSL
jgi:hypothetical protein